MPIVFIVSGCTLIYLLFNFSRYCKKFSYYALTLMLVCILFSYFVGIVSIGSIAYNVFSLISILLLLSMLVYRLKFDVLWLVATLLSCISFEYLLSTSSDYSLTFSTILLLIIFLISFLFIFDFYKGIMYILTSGIVLSFMSSSVDIDNFGFSFLQLNFVFELLFAFVCVYLSFMCLNYWFKVFSRRIKNGVYKENVFGFDAISNVFGAF